MIAGHFGRKKTREAIRRRLDWPGIATDVKILYQSCPVHQKARPAIVTRAPLHSLPILKNLFLRLAMDIFGPLKNMRTWKKYILIAMDYTTKWPEAFALKQVFERLRATGLCIKQKKCSFTVNNRVYLGHVVGGGKIKPMECKIQAVREYKQPQTKKQVRVFLGLCGYYRRFIPSFSTIANPLTELTRKNRENLVKWDSHCELAFNSLKKALTQHPVLTPPDWENQFVLQTDASATGLGYVLSQRNQDGEEHLVAYGSRNYYSGEQKYSAIEREALAIVSGIKH